MQIKTVTWEETYKMFDQGERVTPTSPRCPLPPGEYVVTRCVPPSCPGDDSVVFVDGRQTGVSCEYLTAIEKLNMGGK